MKIIVTTTQSVKESDTLLQEFAGDPVGICAPPQKKPGLYIQGT